MMMILDNYFTYPAVVPTLLHGTSATLAIAIDEKVHNFAERGRRSDGQGSHLKT